MPLPILAHQAPILPLKMRWPAAWNGTALVVGSIVPDLEYLKLPDLEVVPFSGLPSRSFTHSLVGQLVFCLPVTLALVMAVGHLRLGEALVARVPERLRPSFGWLVPIATDVQRRGGLVRAVVSALVGSASHVVLDRLTHYVLPAWFPESKLRVGHVRFTTTTLVQLGVSLVAALLSLWMLRVLSRRHVNVIPTNRGGRLMVGLLALAGGALGLSLARPTLRHPDWYFAAGRVYVWGHTAFLLGCGVAAGVLFAGVLLSLWDRRVSTAIDSQPTL